MRISSTYQKAVSTSQYESKRSAEEEIATDTAKPNDDAVVVEISEEGKYAFGLKDKKEMLQDITFLDKSANYLPEYSGIYGVDKAIAVAVEHCTKEEQAFVYDIIRQNFLVGNSGGMTEEERQANISLGMKKSEYAAGSFIREENKKAFLDAMELAAKLASAGKTDHNGNMDYGVKKGNYLGHGSNLIYTTDGLDMMKTMDSKAYEEYQKIGEESSNTDRPLNTLRYLTKWYSNAVKKNSHMIDNYEAKSEEYVEKNVNNQKLDATFADIRTENKNVFIESLKDFQNNNPRFLATMINRELSLKFWQK